MAVPICSLSRWGVKSSTAISSTANSSNAISSTAKLIYSVDEFARCQLIDRHFHRQPTGATFGGSWIFYNECYCLARWSYTCQHLYPTLLPLNQAWDNAHQYLPRWCNHHLKSNYWLVLVGKHWSLIQGKEGRIQVLAGLAPSSQTVGSNKERTGATKSLAVDEYVCWWVDT